MDTRFPILSTVSGMGAGATMVAVSHPLSTMADVSRQGVWATAKRTTSLMGLRALYKGAPLASGALSSGLCLGANDVIRGIVSISTGVFFGVSNLVRTRCFAEDQSLQAVVVGGAVGGIVSISTGVFFGVSNLVRTRCFAEDQSLQAVVVGGAVGGIVSETTRLSLENVSAYAKAVKLVGPSAGFHSIVKSMGTQVARSLPGTVSFVITASA
eukprot:CAMPEP_0179460392 /NCGR_PEP_ID=MMETSP0799-20121207/43457_1 /TAXON_ID=46947 /ORGANISM="Geminigera cryophila, Strain CCMP2564" /LENGTH=211 /DNA_ID=CAMNT_0021262627 /DNA_START=66 /DNA_END=697 /DNA_ORIENTATION=+